MRRVWLVSALLLLGCGSSDDSKEPSWVGAKGVRITQVSIYQGPKRVLMQDGASVPGSVPLVAGRPAYLRLFHATDADYDGQPVTARLELAGGTRLDQPIAALPPETLEEDLGSGVGFMLAGEQVGSTFDYSVGLLRQEEEGDNPAARFAESVPVEGHENTLRLVIVPYRYDADGSGRLPNTSAEQIEAIKNRFLGLYPISKIDVQVHEPVPWSQPLAKDGTGWQALGLNLFGLRNKEKTGDDVYYYGMFNPADTLAAYCGLSCLLGVTLLNDKPPETGTSALRLGLGVGFEKEAADTCAHEIGHAHGRAHVKCGFGLDPSSIDPSYPYDGKTIGGWSLDITANPPVLVDPSHTDIMGYCAKQWISDYNYGKLFVRSQNVNLAYFIGEETAYDIVAFDGLGTVTWLENELRSRPLDGTELTLEALDAAGNARKVSGVWLPYDHLPGGWLFVPAGAARELSFEIEGRRLSAKAPRR